MLLSNLTNRLIGPLALIMTSDSTRAIRNQVVQLGVDSSQVVVRLGRWTTAKWMGNSSWTGRRSLGLIVFRPNRVSLVISCPAISCLIHFPADWSRRPQSSYRWEKLLAPHPSQSQMPPSFPVTAAIPLPSQSPPFTASAGQKPARRKLTIRPIPTAVRRRWPSACPSSAATAMSHLLFHGILKNSPTSDGL